MQVCIWLYFWYIKKKYKKSGYISKYRVKFTGMECHLNVFESAMNYVYLGIIRLYLSIFASNF